MAALSSVATLYMYAQEKGLTLHFEDLGSVGPDHLKTFTQRVVLDGEALSEGEGKSKKEAKENAAEEALKCLKNKDQDLIDDITDETRSLSVTDSLKKGNYIGLVNQYCQGKKLTHSFIEVDKRGPAHDHEFVYKLVINSKEYPAAKGKTVKEAKQNAAHLAWSALQEQSNSDNKVSISSVASEDDAPSVSSAPSSTLDTSEPSSQGTSTNRSDWIEFADSQTPASAQVPAGNTSSKSRFTSDFDSIECLGKGGYGQVYKARNILTNNYFAIKIVHFKEKALKEVRALTHLHHPNIVRYYTCWIEDSKYNQGRSTNKQQYLYIEMELCNKTLEEWIKDRNEEIVEDSKRREGSLNIFQQIVNGVEYIHLEKLIHRDLKPANIMFGKDEKVKIGDFGLVTVDADDEMERTDKKGTFPYAAPEQWSQRNYDRRVDIFALGLIYLELLWKFSTGHERREVLQDARSQKLPKQFSSTFPEENRIIKSMLNEKVEHRPEASNLKTELTDWAKRLNSLPEEIRSV